MVKRKQEPVDCTKCHSCFPIGEGDFMCDKWDKMSDEPIIVIEDYVPTSDFAKCNGKYFEK